MNTHLQEKAVRKHCRPPHTAASITSTDTMVIIYARTIIAIQVALINHKLFMVPAMANFNAISNKHILVLLIATTQIRIRLSL